MTRVVAKELPLELTATSKAMTPNPEAVAMPRIQSFHTPRCQIYLKLSLQLL
jgi:hypothetical protein